MSKELCSVSDTSMPQTLPCPQCGNPTRPHRVYCSQQCYNANRRENPGKHSGVKVLDITGERYGRLIALEYVGRRYFGKQSHSIWKFKCDCGNIVNRDVSHVRRGESTSCGCYRRELDEQVTGARYRLNSGESSFNGIYTHYKVQAIKRKFKWSLTREQFKQLTQQNCHYCGLPPSQKYLTNRQSNGAYIYSGVDRVDSRKGYVYDNCVPCCRECNFAKRALSRDDFLNWITRVYQHQKRLGNVE